MNASKPLQGPGHRVALGLCAILPALAFGAPTNAVGTAAPAVPDNSSWTLVTPAAAFSPRDSAKGCIFKDKMWLNNGYYHGNVDICDLWNSEDGKTWTLVLDKTPYDHYADVAGFKDKLWAVKKAVWSSPDGVSWTREMETAPFGACAELFVFKDKMWALASSAVWNTTNGLDWVCVAKDLSFGRGAFAFAVFQDALWVMGGVINKVNDPPEAGYTNRTTLNDVWKSADGANWERVVEKAPWAPRQWFKAAAYKGRLWIFGGYDNVHRANLGDVWSTTDGRTWERFKPEAPWTPRHEPTLFVFKDSVYMAAGNSWPVRNDVWKLTLP